MQARQNKFHVFVPYNASRNLYTWGYSQNSEDSLTQGRQEEESSGKHPNHFSITVCFVFPSLVPVHTAAKKWSKIWKETVHMQFQEQFIAAFKISRVSISQCYRKDHSYFQ